MAQQNHQNLQMTPQVTENQQEELLKTESSIREIVEKDEDESQIELDQGDGTRVPSPRRREEEVIEPPEELPMGCWQRIARKLGIMYPIDDKNRYEIEVSIQRLQMELDLERQQRIALELQLNSIKQEPKPSYDTSERVSKLQSVVLEHSLEMKAPAELVGVNCSQRMLQQEPNLLHADDLFMMAKESPAAQAPPTGRDATYRQVALNRNLQQQQSFDQPQLTHSTGRSQHLREAEEKQEVRMLPSFGFAREESFYDVTKRAPEKPQMIQDGEAILIEQQEVDIAQQQEIRDKLQSKTIQDDSPKFRSDNIQIPVEESIAKNTSTKYVEMPIQSAKQAEESVINIESLNNQIDLRQPEEPAHEEPPSFHEEEAKEPDAETHTEVIERDQDVAVHVKPVGVQVQEELVQQVEPAAPEKEIAAVTAFMAVESGDAGEGEAKVDEQVEELVEPDQPDVVPGDDAGDGQGDFKDVADNIHVEVEPVIFDILLVSPICEQICMSSLFEKEVLAEKNEELPSVADIKIEASEPVQKEVMEHGIVKTEAQAEPEEPQKSIVSETTNELATKEKITTELLPVTTQQVLPLEIPPKKLKQYVEPALTPNPFFLEEVINWEKRIAAYSPQVQAKYKIAFSKMDELLQLFNADPKTFKVTINDKKSGLLCEQRTSGRGNPMVRVTVKYDYPALVAWRACVNCENRPKYDANVDVNKLMTQIGTNLVTCYQKSKRIATVAPRDIYQDVLSNHYPNGMIRTVLYQDPNDKHPETKGVVRMVAPIAGFELVPDPSDPGKCSCRQIIEFDLKGKIPGFVQAQVIKDTAQGLNKIKKHIDPWLAKKSDDGKQTWRERMKNELPLKQQEDLDQYE